MNWSLRDRQDLDMRSGLREDVPGKSSKLQTVEMEISLFLLEHRFLSEIEVLYIVKSSENLHNLSWSFTLHFQCCCSINLFQGMAHLDNNNTV